MPDMIQPHGVMLILRPADLTILQTSENITGFFGVEAGSLVLKGLADLLGASQAANLHGAISHISDRLNNGPCQVPQEIHSPDCSHTFCAMAHHSGDVLILELELIDHESARRVDGEAELADCMSALGRAGSLQAFLDIAAMKVRAFTGFDRVLVYQFAADGSGEVIAEAKSSALVGYLGKHFPPSDLPAPARRLLSLSWLRHLPNADYVPVKIVPQRAEPVDMSRAVLRHVSVIYTAWLKNIGAHATLVMPVMKAGRLWGLISCMHHAGPLHVPYDARGLSELLAHFVSLQLAQREDYDQAAYRQRMTDAIAALRRQMEQQVAYDQGLSGGEFSLHGWMDEAGAALVTEKGIILLGLTPSREEVSGIVAWLDRHMESQPIWATDRLAEVYPRARDFQATASGLLAARLMHSRPGFVIWFRPEILRTVHWAGDPRKPVQVDVVDGEARLTPRVSFDLWKETVRGRCAPWLDCEIEAAETLRRVIAEVTLARMNEDLKRSNNELDTFAFVASHDLKEPLRGISNFAEFFRRSATAKLTAEEQGRIETIIRLTRRMNDLTDALLEYSRVARGEVQVETVDLNALLREIVDALRPRLVESGVDVRVPLKLPTMRTDRARLGQVLTELIANAIKYNDRKLIERWVEISWQIRGGQSTFSVRDNGIGISPQHLEDVFQMFHRLHPRDAYGGGNGAGLTVARRIVERLGGRLWAESGGVDEGASFYFTFGVFTSNEAPSGLA